MPVGACHECCLSLVTWVADGLQCVGTQGVDASGCNPKPRALCYWRGVPCSWCCGCDSCSAAAQSMMCRDAHNGRVYQLMFDMSASVFLHVFCMASLATGTRASVYCARIEEGSEQGHKLVVGERAAAHNCLMSFWHGGCPVYHLPVPECRRVGEMEQCCQLSRCG